MLGSTGVYHHSIQDLRFVFKVQDPFCLLMLENGLGMNLYGLACFDLGIA